LSREVREEVRVGLAEFETARLTETLHYLGLPVSSWYRSKKRGDRQRPGPKKKPFPVELERSIRSVAEANPWYGYKRIAVMCRRVGLQVTNRQVYRVMKKHDLLQKRKARPAALYQAAKLWELLPDRPNGLWQMDVTYIHIPGHGWWYVVTVIDYYSRYLLAGYLTNSYSALEVTKALDMARDEAERLHGPLTRMPFLVTDNGPSFMAKRFHQSVSGQFSHVRIQYRTPTQLGLLERFHQTLKEEEIYWQIYDSPAHARDGIDAFRARYNQDRPHWALIPQSGGDPYTPHDVYVHGLATKIPKWQGWAKKAKQHLECLLQSEAA
jgi:transposase InsO family protein